MILSGRDLQLYIQTGRLKISPVRLEQFQQNGFDCILENVKRVNQIFYLASTRETIEMPDDLMAFVGIRSTWARSGFSLPLTIVDAGFRGNLTLEINRFTDTLFPIGERFVHLVFAKTSGPCVPYDGIYQDQEGITEAREVRD